MQPGDVVDLQLDEQLSEPCSVVAERQPPDERGTVPPAEREDRQQLLCTASPRTSTTLVP
jgi:hypothetical protein